MQLSKSFEVTMVPDDDFHQEKHPEFMEEGVVVPFDKLAPDTLKNLISEFVTREWEEVGDSSASLEDKVSQVMQQLKMKKAKVVFDLRSETCNIVVVERG